MSGSFVLTLRAYRRREVQKIREQQLLAELARERESHRTHEMCINQITYGACTPQEMCIRDRRTGGCAWQHGFPVWCRSPFYRTTEVVCSFVLGFEQPAQEAQGDVYKRQVPSRQNPEGKNK